MSTILTFVGLVLAAIGAWVVIGFVRYRSYYQKVRYRLLATGSEDIAQLVGDRFLELDDAIRRCYFAQLDVSEAASRALEALMTRGQ